MKIIEPNVKEVTDFEGVDNFYKAVARAARICYASDKTTDDRKLVERLIESKHFSPFEHAVIYVQFGNLDRSYYLSHKDENLNYRILLACIDNKYSQKFRGVKRHVHYTTDYDFYAINGRVIVESIIKTIDVHDKDITLIIDELFNNCNVIIEHKFKSFIVDTSIGCTREMNRHHDNFYICEKSTRYCNFSKDKFENEVAFNRPYWYDTASTSKQDAWKFAMGQAEYNYLEALKKEFITDEARGILPLDTHTKAIYTATIEEWKHFIQLRYYGTTGKPHGDIHLIADKIRQKIYD